MIAVANFIGLPLIFLSAIRSSPRQMPHWIEVARELQPGELGRPRRPERDRGRRRLGRGGMYLGLLVAATALHVIVRDVVLPRLPAIDLAAQAPEWARAGVPARARTLKAAACAAAGPPMVRRSPARRCHGTAGPQAVRQAARRRSFVDDSRAPGHGLSSSSLGSTSPRARRVRPVSRSRTASCGSRPTASPRRRTGRPDASRTAHDRCGRRRPRARPAGDELGTIGGLRPRPLRREARRPVRQRARRRRDRAMRRLDVAHRRGALGRVGTAQGRARRPARPCRPARRRVRRPPPPLPAPPSSVARVQPRRQPLATRPRTRASRRGLRAPWTPTPRAHRDSVLQLGLRPWTTLSADRSAARPPARLLATGCESSRVGGRTGSVASRFAGPRRVGHVVRATRRFAVRRDHADRPGRSPPARRPRRRAPSRPCRGARAPRSPSSSPRRCRSRRRPRPRRRRRPHREHGALHRADDRVRSAAVTAPRRRSRRRRASSRVRGSGRTTRTSKRRPSTSTVGVASRSTLPSGAAASGCAADARTPPHAAPARSRLDEAVARLARDEAGMREQRAVEAEQRRRRLRSRTRRAPAASAAVRARGRRRARSASRSSGRRARDLRAGRDARVDAHARARRLAVAA